MLIVVILARQLGSLNLKSDSASEQCAEQQWCEGPQRHKAMEGAGATPMLGDFKGVGIASSDEFLKLGHGAIRNWAQT